MSSSNPNTVSYSEGTDLSTPITVEFDGRTRQRFDTVVEDPAAKRTADRAKSRLKVCSTAEAEALLSLFAGMNLLSFDPQMIPTLHRVRDELVAALERRGYAVEDGALCEQELVADGGHETCSDCGAPVTHTVVAGPSEARNSCGCRVNPETLVADGGITWSDLHAFKRDCLEAIRRLDQDGETTYGLAILSELERVYGREITHGRLYPNLDDLIDAGLVEKSELDKRTNEYELTASAEAMLEQRARLLADACGMEQPVADGGDSA